MLGRRVVGGFIRLTPCLRSVPALEVEGSTTRPPHTELKKIFHKAVRDMGRTIEQFEFEEFKKKNIKPIEEFASSPAIQALCGTDKEKIAKAYNDYCVSKFNRAKLLENGGNPATMV